jgi:uncharacterized OsmC-like protein
VVPAPEVGQTHRLSLLVAQPKVRHGWIERNPFRHKHLHYIVRGRGLDEKAVADAIRLSEEKYCSVSTTLAKAVELTREYRIVEEPAA